MSGFSAFALASVAAISLSSGGSWSSITIWMPSPAASASTPARMSWLKGSFSKAPASFSVAGSRPSRSASSAASATALARYCSVVESTAKR